jgi:hypothetical protein
VFCFGRGRGDAIAHLTRYLSFSGAFSVSLRMIEAL